MPTANIVESVLIYDDPENISNPQLKHVDWKRSVLGLSFDTVHSQRFLVAPGYTETLVDGVGAVDFANLVVDFQTVPARPTWYQLRVALTPTPWAQGIVTTGGDLTLTVQVDGTAILAGAAFGNLSSVLPGDQIYLAGDQYGDVGSFSAANQGFWEAISVGVATITMSRVNSSDSMLTETVTTFTDYDVQFIPAILRPRWLFIQGAAPYSGIYEVVGAAKDWLAVVAPAAFVPATSVSLTTAIAASKYISYIRVESDQPVSVLVGDSHVNYSNNISLIPPSAGVSGWYEAYAFAIQLAVQNSGGNLPAVVNVIYAYNGDDVPNSANIVVGGS